MKPDKKKPNSVASVGTDFLKKLKEVKQLNKVKLENDIRTQGGPKEFLSTKYPNLSRTAPNELLEGSLTRHTLVGIKDAERRLQACAKCPSTGGGCSQDTLGYSRGLQPSWRSGQLMFSVCSRWPEYQLRSRIINGGVPERYASVALADVLDRLRSEPRTELVAFVKGARKGSGTIVVGGELASPVCVAMLRSVVVGNDTVSFKFDRARALIRPLKNYFQDSRDNKDPLLDLTSADVAVVTELSNSDPEWFIEALREVLYTRFLNNKITILGVHTGRLSAACELYFSQLVRMCDTGARVG